jgi:predicted membrane protein
MNNRPHPGLNNSGIIGGTVIVLVGLAFLLDNLGIIAVTHLFRFWPMILVVAGLAALSTQQGRVKGVVMIAIGALFELDALGIAHFRWSSLWPIAIIAAGVMVMWTTLEARHVGGSSDPRTTLNEFALFGGIERRITTPDFKGGVVTAVFGGVEIDLRQAAIAEDTIELTLNVMFGGCELRVPETWEIVGHGQGIFGGFVDSTKTRNFQPDTLAGTLSGTPRKTVILHGIAFFGGVEIKN